MEKQDGLFQKVNCNSEKNLNQEIKTRENKIRESKIKFNQ